MFDDPADTDAAAATEPEPEAGQDDPPASAEEQAAAAEEDAAWNEVLAEANGEDPPAPAGESSEEEPETPAAEAGGAGEEETPEEPAAPAAGAAGAEPAEEPGAAEAAAAAAAEADPETEADIDWDQVDPKVKAAFDAKAAEASRAVHAFKSREGREAALQRRLDAVMAGKDGPQEEQPADEQPAEPPPVVSLADDEDFQKEWKGIVDNYPELAGPIGKAFDLLQTSFNQNIAHLRQEGAALKKENEGLKLGMQQVGEDRLAAASDAAEQQVLEAHPDVDDIADSDDFVAWVDEQPEFIREAALANAKSIVDPAAAIRILDDYKRDKGLVNGARNGASTAEPEPAAGQQAGNGAEPGAQKPAASARRDIQRQSASAPAPSPGAPAREEDPTQGETEDDVWREVITAEKRKQRAAEARA